MSKDEILNRCANFEKKYRELLAEFMDIQYAVAQQRLEQEIAAPELITIQDAAKRTGLSESALWSWCKQDAKDRGFLIVKVGKKTLINFGSLCRFLNKGDIV